MQIRSRGERWLALGVWSAGMFTLMWWALRVWPDTPDGWFHLQRVRALSDAFRWGVLFPRWFPDFAFGYGYPVFHFYAALSYYPAAMLTFLGLDPLPAMRWSLAAGYALSSSVMFVLLRRRFSWPGAWVGTAVYAFWPYRWYDVVVRGAWPEFHAFFWFPLVFFLAFPEGKRRTLRGLDRLWAGVVWAGLVFTHNLSAFLMGGLLFFFLLDALARNRREGLRRLRDGGLPLVLGLTLCAFYVLPVVTEMRFVGVGSGAGGDVSPHLISPRQLFSWHPAFPYPTADVPVVPVPGYVLGVILAAAGLLWKARARREGEWSWVWGTSVLLLFLLTTWSAPVWQGAAFALARLQFPWRWEAPLGLLVALLTALVVQEGVPSKGLLQYGLVVGLVVGLGVYGLAGVHTHAASFHRDSVTVERMWAFDAAHGQVGATWTGEFLPSTVREQRWAIGRAPASPSPVPLMSPPQVQVVETGFSSWMLETVGSRASFLVWHLFYYPAWEAQVDGWRVRTYPVTNLGLLGVRLPPGRHRVRLAWRGLWGERVGFLLSLVAWSGVLVGLVFWSRAREAGVARALAFIVMAVVLWRLVLPHGFRVPVRSPRASYPGVSLAGCVLVPAPPRELRVRLFWLGESFPGPRASVFVHVVDEDGRLVAQHDAPLGLGYTPPERWFPGLLVSEDHSLPRPPKGGEYQIRVGLYDPAHPDAPFATHLGARWVACGRVEE